MSNLAMEGPEVAVTAALGPSHGAPPARPNAVKDALTPSRPREVVEIPEYAAFVGRILRAAGRRVGDGDVEGLAYLVALRSELEAAITEAVHGLRAAPWGYSWAQVAQVLGTTRQAAQQHYGARERPNADRSAPGA